MTTRTVSLSYQASVDISAAERGYDAKFRLTRPLDRNTMAAISAAGADVVFVASMMRVKVARMRANGVALVHSHGAVPHFVLPGAQELARFQVLEGILPVKRLHGQMVINQGHGHCSAGPGSVDR